jgi:hypothetical protein
MTSEDELAVPSWPLRHARLCAALLCSALACLLPTLRADAQAMPTASKSNDISAFVGGTYSNPQYGPEQDKGITFGANLIEHLHFPVSPSIEGRANITSGTYIGERSYLGGLRAQGDVLHYLHPSGDFLVGGGDLHFDLSSGQTYVTSLTTVYSYGGGVDVDAYRQFQLTLDVQQQSWSIGTPFHPWIAMVGVTYRLRFRDYNRRGDPQ